MKDLFINSPTIGNGYNATPAEDNAGAIQNLEQRIQHLEQEGVARENGQYYNESGCDERKDDQAPRRKRVKWGKIKKFFTAVIKPILIFIPNFLNAIANIKRAFTPIKA